MQQFPVFPASATGTFNLDQHNHRTAWSSRFFCQKKCLAIQCNFCQLIVIFNEAKKFYSFSLIRIPSLPFSRLIAHD
jgi:hypothetical protein